MTKYFWHSYYFAGLLLISAFGVFCHGAIAGGCPIVDRYPHTSSFLLSNGKYVNLPTKSDDFDVVAVIATMDYQKTLKLVRAQKSNGYPLMAGKKALGMMMVYQYHQSDLGPFNEIYFLTPMSDKPIKGTLATILALKKLNRRLDKPPVSDIYFFYFKVYSGTEMAQLGSREIWGIESSLASIKANDWKKNKMRVLHLSELGPLESQHLMSFQATKMKTWFPNTGKINMLIAGGQKDDLRPVYSPVLSCGKMHLGKFNPKQHELTFNQNSDLGQLLSGLNFHPIIVGEALGMQAVQFAPISKP